MSDRRSLGRRVAGLFRWLLSMLEEKRDGRRRLSMTRCAVAAFTVAYVLRLWHLDALGWPDAFLAFCVLFAIPVAKKLDQTPPETVVEAVTGMFGRGASVSPAALGGPSTGYRRPPEIPTDASPAFEREGDER